MLAQQDRHELGLLCDAYREYRVARRHVEHDGMMVVRVTKAGMVRVRHPLISVYQDAWRRVRLALIDFGLNPSARSKTSSRPEEVADPLEELLKRSGNSG